MPRSNEACLNNWNNRYGWFALGGLSLEHTDWDIYGLCRWRSPLSNIAHLLDKIENGDRVFLEYGDINDYVSLVDVVKKALPDYVFHLAAQSYPKTSFSSPIETLNTNILGTAKLLEAVKSVCTNEMPIIHVCASSEVFGRVSSENSQYMRMKPFILPLLMQFQK